MSSLTENVEYDELSSQFEKLIIDNKFKPLSDKENLIVDQLFKKGQSGLVSQFKRATVNYKDIYRLCPDTWLNDEIINFYFELLSNTTSSLYCFNSFFFSTLQDHGYLKVKRWTKKIDVFSKDLLFIPINQDLHWILGVVDIKNKKVFIYDSLGGNHDQKLSLLLTYLQDEHDDKKQTSLSTKDWIKETPKDIPQQDNMSDCGVFVCAFAEKLCLKQSFNFTQKDMNSIRRRIALNIVNKSINN